MGITLQEIFAQHFDSFALRYRVSSDGYRAAWCIEHCRTRWLGGHVNSCPEGHVHQIAYNSCRHRCCPKCAWVEREKWLTRWKQRLLPCPHHHIVFTLPNELSRIWHWNKAEYGDTLFAAATETLTELLNDPKYLGARIGLLSALHTWKQTLLTHVHLHCLVTAGGLTQDGNWIKPKKDCLLPRKVLMIKFRGKFKAMLRAKVKSGKIQLPDGMNAEALDSLLRQVSKKPWNVKIHDAYKHGVGVASYLAGYLKGGPIGGSRLLRLRDGKVMFRYRLGTQAGGDGKRQGVMELPVETFIGRWLMHVPPKRYQTVRGYGLYSGNQHSRLDLARESLGHTVEPIKEVSWQERCERAGMKKACCCPVCGRTLVSHHEFSRGRDPPEEAFQWQPQPMQAA